MMMPGEDSWVACRKVAVRPGKVRKLNQSRGVFTAIFLNKQDAVDYRHPREFEVELHDILTFINDKAQVDALNKELDNLVGKI